MNEVIEPVVEITKSVIEYDIEIIEFKEILNNILNRVEILTTIVMYLLVFGLSLFVIIILYKFMRLFI